MINLLNKLLARFDLNIVKNPVVILQEEPVKQNSFIDDITTPEFAKKHPEVLDRYLSAKKHSSLYVGDINYIEDNKGKTYYKDNNTKNYYSDYDVKNPSTEVLGHMISETTFTQEGLTEKLKND
jgi:hypothetical protein